MQQDEFYDMPKDKFGGISKMRLMVCCIIRLVIGGVMSCVSGQKCGVYAHKYNSNYPQYLSFAFVQGVETWCAPYIYT